MLVLDSTRQATLLDPKSAQEALMSLNDGFDDFKYIPHSVGKYVKIEVLDENNDHVGWL